jgi:hypothetical protein
MGTSLIEASNQPQTLAKKVMEERMPADQRSVVPKIPSGRFIDLIRTGR